ncbi:MAG: thiamine-phosphate synthase family protein [Candidatus Hodarchaeota archaeon]
MRFACETVVKSFLTTYRHNLIHSLKKEGWTQQKIADKLSFTQAAVSNYLNKKIDESATNFYLACDLVDRTLESVKQPEMNLSSIMGEICHTCKLQRVPRKDFCKQHVKDFSILADESCQICSKYLNQDIFEVEDEKSGIIKDLIDNFNRIRFNKKFISLIPEVQSNLVLGMKDPTKNAQVDYAAFPGRIIKVEGEAKISGMPKFGVSRHIVRILSVTRMYFPGLRSAICIAYNDKVEQITGKAKLTSIYLADEDDPNELKSELSEFKGKDLDAVIFKGAIGKEPIVYLLGNSADEVIDKFENLVTYL